MDSHVLSNSDQEVITSTSYRDVIKDRAVCEQYFAIKAPVVMVTAGIRVFPALVGPYVDAVKVLGFEMPTDDLVVFLISRAVHVTGGTLTGRAHYTLGIMPLTPLITGVDSRIIPPRQFQGLGTVAGKELLPLDVRESLMLDRPDFLDHMYEYLTSIRVKQQIN